MTTPEDIRLRTRFIIAAAVMAIGKLIKRGEVAGNVTVAQEDIDAAEHFFDRCMKAGMPKVTSDELSAAIEYIRLRGGVIEVTPLGDAAEAYDRMFQGAGEG